MKTEFNKGINRLYIILLVLFFSEIGLAQFVERRLGTRVRICAVKGEVSTYYPDSPDNICTLEQKQDKTKCRIFNRETVLETGENGWAEIIYPGGHTIKIHPETKIKISRHDIYIYHGSSWYKSEKTASGEIIIKTPTVHTGLCDSHACLNEYWNAEGWPIGWKKSNRTRRELNTKKTPTITEFGGTEFLVEVAKDGTSAVKSIEGQIEVSDIHDKSSILLNVGIQVTIEPNSSFITPAMLNLKKEDKWWTDWPTLVPLDEPEISDVPGNTLSDGNSINPISDSHIYQYTYSDWNRCNWGAYEFLGAGYHPMGGEKRAYLKFDIGNVRPNDIGKATLRLYQNHKAGSIDLKLGVYEVKEAWVEGRGTYKPQTLATGNEICWINQPDFETTLISSFSPGSSVNQWVEVDVSQLVRDWAAGMPNHGLMIKAIGPLSGRVECNYGFYSRECEDESKRPQLIITPMSKEGEHFSSDTYEEINAGFEFTDNFEHGTGNWDVSRSGAKIENGQLFWQEGNHNGVNLDVEVPMGDLVIEFDGWTSSNGIAVEWKDGQKDGYNISLGAYYNTGSYLGHIDKGKNEWTIYKGAHLTVNKWQHYKFIVEGTILKAYLDHQLIGEHELPFPLAGKGLLKFSAYGTKVGIDNVRIYELNKRVEGPSSIIGLNIKNEINLEKRWIHELRDVDDKRLVGHSLAIGIDGAIYYVAQAQFIQPQIHAINQRTGKLLWKTAPMEVPGIGSDIVVGDDGTLHITAGHSIYAFDHRTGGTKWIWEVPETLPNPDDPDRQVSTRAGLNYLALTDDGNLITTTGASGSYYRGIYGVTKNGIKYFHNLKAVGTGISGGLSIGKNNTVYYLANSMSVGELGNYLVALDVNTGKIKWTKKILSTVTGSNNIAIMDNGNIFCAYPVENHSDKSYYILDGESGSILWKSSENADQLLVKLIGPDGSMYLQWNALKVDGNTGKTKSIYSGATLGTFTEDNHIIAVYGRGRSWGREIGIFDPNGDGEPLSTINVGSVMGENMVISDDGVIYAIINNTNYPSRVPTQICAIQGHAPLAKSGWPRRAYDNRNTSNINKGKGQVIGHVVNDNDMDDRVSLDPDWDEEDALNPELQAAYERYIAAYNRLTRLMAEGKGETVEARQAYDAYILAKKNYNEKYHN